ncbi:MAG: hypothetical protein ACLVF9_02955 [Enterocloster sp.]
MFMKPRFGMVGTASYLYYMLYELYSPVIEVAGLAVTAVAALAGLLNIRISRQDVFRACIMCLIENVFFRFVFDFIRLNAFVSYRKNKGNWGTIKRIRYTEAK